MQDKASLDATSINTIRTLSTNAVQMSNCGYDNEDIEEFPLLLLCDDVTALIEAARRQSLTAAGLARRLIRDYLRKIQGTHNKPFPTGETP